MKIAICKNTHTYIMNQHIPYGAWYGADSKGWWFCTAHGKSKDGSLELYRYNGQRWVKSQENSATTRSVCAWAESAGLWWTKCHWFKDEDRQKSLVAKQNDHMKMYENLMKHRR